MKSTESAPANTTRTTVAIITWAVLLITCYFYNIPLFRLINGHYSEFGDRIFSLVTCLGDGLVLGIILFFLWPRSAIFSLLGLESLILSGILVQILKQSLMTPRPLAVFDQVHLVGAEFLKGSFPSGHTASAFAVGYLFFFYCTRRRWKVLAIILAVLVGYSRVYIGIHFLLDAVAGAGIGVFCTRMVLNHKTSLQGWLEAMSDKSCARLHRMMMGILAGGGVFLLFFYDQLPQENIWLGNLLGISAFLVGLFFLRERKKPDNFVAA